MKSIILFFIFLGILLVIWNQQNYRTPPATIRYQYIPRDLLQDQYAALPVLAQYGDLLFSGQDPWTVSIGENLFSPSKREVFQPAA